MQRTDFQTERFFRWMLVCLCAGLLCVAGCDSKDEREGASEEDVGLTQTASAGEVTVTVTTDRSRARVAEAIRLTVEVAAPVDVDIGLPQLPELLADFTIQDEGVLEVIGTDDTRTWRQILVIDSNLSGERVIPPIPVLVGDTAESVTTDSLTVEVASAIEGDGEFDPTQMADIEGPVALPKPGGLLPVYVGLGLVVALAVLIWLLVRNSRARSVAAAPPPPPHVWALAELDVLLAEKLIERGLLHEFYYRLSGIVRTYIELRFGLVAPERTTEEFLSEATRSNAPGWGHKDLLGEFLLACDLVKFARHEPRGAEIDASIQTARSFVQETAPGPVSPRTEVAA